MSNKSVVDAYAKLEAAWNAKPQKLEECGTLLGSLKVTLAKSQMDFLPTSNSPVEKADIILARSILEIGAQYSIATEDITSFERYIAQLKCYYLDYKADARDESAYKQQLLGLNLLRLLAQNKLADFHTELELLSLVDIQTNIYIKHPVQIEQYLMEGSYNKVFLASGNIPAKMYKFFMDRLLNTIRNEIASCIEIAYEKISFPESTRMLFCKSPGAMTTYAQERKWTLNPKDNCFHFHREKKADDVIPTMDLAAQAIEYARELEMIV